jgi:hypothetical protein
MSFDKIIDVYDRPPVKPRRSLPAEPFIASAHKIVEQANQNLLEARKIPQEHVDEIVSREQANPAVAQRALLNFISTVENPNTANPTRHVDLLPVGHPMSPAEKTPEAVAEYFSSDPYFKDDSVRTLVASAILSNPESASRKFITSQLSVRDPYGYFTDVIAHADALITRI